MNKRLMTILWTVLAAAPALAQTAPAAAAKPGPANDMPTMILFMGAIFILFYVIVIRPQKNEQKKREEDVNKVSKGDKVVTIGGLHGTVEAINVSEGTITLTVAPKTSLKFNKSAIQTVSAKGRGGEAKDEPKEIAQG